MIDADPLEASFSVSLSMNDDGDPYDLIDRVVLKCTEWQRADQQMSTRDFADRFLKEAVNGSLIEVLDSFWDK